MSVVGPLEQPLTIGYWGRCPTYNFVPILRCFWFPPDFPKSISQSHFVPSNQFPDYPFSQTFSFPIVPFPKTNFPKSFSFTRKKFLQPQKIKSVTRYIENCFREMGSSDYFFWKFTIQEIGFGKLKICEIKCLGKWVIGKLAIQDHGFRKLFHNLINDR